MRGCDAAAALTLRFRALATRASVGVASLGVLAGCAGASVDALGIPLHRPVTERQLARLPQSHVLYPGSLVVRQVGSDERRQRGEAEPDPAYAGVVATAHASPAELLRWYDDQMRGRGYRAATYYRAANQSTGGAWTLPGNREQVQVGVLASSRATAAVGVVTYQVVLVSYRVTGPPPS
jgi:hypothetical protein